METSLEVRHGRGAIYKELSKVMAEVGKVPKKGRNTHFGYDYVKEDDLTEAIRPLLAKHGLSLSYSVISAEQIRDDITRVTVQITIGHENGGEIIAFSMGDGQDKGDKGIYKAQTGAVKYWLYKNFLISTGDDPELEEGTKAKQKTGSTNGPNPNPPPEKDNGIGAKPMTESQRKKLYVMMKEKGITGDKAKDFFAFLKSGKEEVSQSDASDFIEKFETYLGGFRQAQGKAADQGVMFKDENKDVPF